MQLRAMGEMEIHSFAHAELPASPPQISDLPEDADKADMINWLGARLDGDTASVTLEEASKRAEIEEMAAYLLGQSDISAEADDFVLMLILREKWPVGSKAAFRKKAERAGADFTYHFLVCPAQQGALADDEESLQKAETQSLSAILPLLKANRKRFASSSGLQQFLKQVG